MNIVLIGRGGHSKVVEDIIRSKEEYNIVAYLDDRFSNFDSINGKYVGPLSAINKVSSFFYDISFVITIGNNLIRKRVSQLLGLSNQDYATLIHSTAVVSPSAKIGHGTVVMASAVINADAQIGDHVIINTGAVVEHDNVVGDYAHLSPGAVLTGNVSIGEGSHVGAGGVIIPNVKMREWSILGAGSTAIKDIPAYSTAVGVPAKVIKKELLEVYED